MPSGPLRESLSGLKRADIILINGKKDTVFENKILEINRNLEIFYSNYIPTNLEEFRNKKLLAIAGIGNPENFFELIEANNLKIERKIVFADHHIFTKSEIKKIVDYATNKNYQIIMTEKDYFKIKHFDLKDIKFLKIHYKISDQEKFLNRISKIYD
jgi:tetraacyldisaccharide 4'-kinase